MYPVLRAFTELFLNRRRPEVGLFDTHVSRHLCWPWDIDLWRELNNGRTLTLYDLGRIGLMERNGMHAMMRAQGWGAAVAGASVRYRKRVTVFQRIEMRTRLVGWGPRFQYIVQEMWVGDDCTSQGMFRIAITNRGKLMRAAEAAEILGLESPPLPDWVQNWVEADNTRPWPPERD